MTPRSTIHTALRDGTADLHHAVEARMNLAGRLDSAATYSDLLRGFLAVLSPLEAQLARFRWPDRLAIEERRKTPLLRADLVDLSGYPEEDRMHGSPDPVILPSQAHAYGSLYVLEGSTLGGRLILRDVQARLGFGPERGARFFAGYGPRTGAMWSAFLAVLADEIVTPAAIAKSVRGARDTFSAMDLWINRAAHSRAA